MADKVTLGGERLGSGEKITVERHNYMMNSFNLEQDWKSTMAPGMLYPCLKIIGTNHGTFDIDVDAFFRTLPTKGPLFGSFKLQVDLFAVPIRLYQGILHNNPTKIGLKMNQVYLPKMILKTADGIGAPRAKGSNDYDYQVHPSSLLKYTGLSGWGIAANASSTSTQSARKLQCVPQLAYYDIFKCYYSNKQEENAYVVTPGDPTEEPLFEKVIQGNLNEDHPEWIIAEYNNGTYDGEDFTTTKDNANTRIFQLVINKANEEQNIDYYLQNIGIQSSETDIYLNVSENAGIRILGTKETDRTITIVWQITDWELFAQYMLDDDETTATEVVIKLLGDINTNFYNTDIKLTPFALDNIDAMRYSLLSCNQLAEEFQIGNLNYWDETSGTDGTGLPYSALIKQTGEGITWNAFHSNGLCVKTYQSDLFNNWLSSEFVDEVTSMTQIDVSGGTLSPDTLNLAEKFYNLLNRIVVGSGTYEDWQEAVYGEGAVRKAETPMYIGGMSAEVMFEEVISNAETKIDNDFQALGSLGGKGTLMNQHGGRNIHCKCEEPSYIMAIASLTPRICYSQGNDWDMTELDTLDDLHKPELDGIGFQDLMVENFAWWDTVLTPGSTTVFHRSAAGKQTAWIHYQTAIDKCYGDFAKQDGYSFMVLNRNYSRSKNNLHGVEDITTYIDPVKYNYAFAVNDLYAQNFWGQIHFKITARRKMGAQQLPNL